MHGFPFSQMPGAFPERPFGFQSQPPQQQVFNKPSFVDMPPSNSNPTMNFLYDPVLILYLPSDYIRV